MIPGLYFIATHRPHAENGREPRLNAVTRPKPPRGDRRRTAHLRDAPRQDLAIRWAQAADAPRLRRLAALDGRPTPDGPALVAERNGTLVAALQLSDGQAVTDPFEPTADVVSLLELRASQLEARTVRRGPWFRRGLLRRTVPAGA